MNVLVAFVSFKKLKLSGGDFGNNAMVAFIIQMIRGAPRLQLLETRVSGMQYVIKLHINLHCHGCASQYYLNLQASKIQVTIHNCLEPRNRMLHLLKKTIGDDECSNQILRVKQLD